MAPSVTEIFALASAAAFGAGDFLGGRAAKTASTLHVTAIAQVASAAVLLPILLIVPAPAVSPADVLWGAAAGIFGLAGVLALYAALAIGPMGAVAPTTAVLSAVVPVAFGLLTGEDPGVWALIGIVFGLVAVFAISGSDGPSGRLGGRVLAMSLGAGLGFALFFIIVAQTSTDSGMWPLVGARTVTVPVILVIAWARSTSSITASLSLAAVVAGGLDMVANAFFLASVQRGLLAIASVLAALYPAVTALLARLVLHERMTSTQLGGVALAVVAIVLIGLP